MDIEGLLRGMVRTGVVASVNVENNTARVLFDEKDHTLSYELHIVHTCSGRNKDYWCPDIGDNVVCIFNANDKNLTNGFILGSFFTEKHPPQVKSMDIKRMDFADGSFFEFNRATGDLRIECTGNIKISGKTIHLN